MSDSRVKEAFIEVRRGRSPEFVICDPKLGDQLILAARRRGVQGTEAHINTELINLRKQNKLKDYPTTHRKKPDPNRHRYIPAVFQAVRLIERQFNKNVDDIICDPNTKTQFDALIQFICPGTPAFESQYAALHLRKVKQLKPEPIGQIIRAISSKILDLKDLESQIFEIPERPGVYIFFDEETTLYAGKANDLRARIREHISTWTFRDLIRKILAGHCPNAFVVFHELAITISPKKLQAYETDLIRSRNPEHNRAGRTF